MSNSSSHPPLTRRYSDLHGVLETVLANARDLGLDEVALAAKAHVSPDAMTQAKNGGPIDWETVVLLAQAVDLDLAVIAVPRSYSAKRSSLADPRFGLAWSNPDAPTDALIARAIERGAFDLILRAAHEHGIAQVAEVLARMREEGDTMESTLAFAERALRNIAIGAEQAKELQPAEVSDKPKQDAKRLAELAPLYAAGNVTWRQIADETGAAFGDLLQELGRQGLKLPRANAPKTPAQQRLFEQMLKRAAGK